ncbi:MAG: DUF4912 domain-containing protein, partial [Verrucomicrobia bacterium]|nr:DUF4912 domain-containing protein [Verrucomicrobiota bacterium]
KTTRSKPKAASGTSRVVAARSTRKVESQKPSAPKPGSRKAPFIPSILLEGDQPPLPSRSGPGDRYVLGASDIGAPSQTLDNVLPEAYGTRKILVFARDPEWLYAHWDFTEEQLRECNAKSADRHLILRVHKEEVSEVPFAEIHVHPESRHWFIHTAQPGVRFMVELGYYTRQRRWKREALSAVALTPPNTMSEDHSVRFATLPMDVSMRQLVGIVKQALPANQPLVDALQQLRDTGHSSLPGPGPIASSVWTPEQDRALAEVLSIDSVRRVWVGSLEITELVKMQIARELSSAAAAGFSLPSSLEASSLSSPFGGAGERRKGFWFNVNAELIIYGATEPDAQVSIGERVIQLRADGTFSYRFSLPDGQYDLPAVAVSNDRTDSRSAGLRFSRRTDYQGHVEAHPQDPALRPPVPASVH